MGEDAVTVEDMRAFLVSYLEYEQRVHVPNEHGEDRALARRGELVDSATQIMVDYGFYDGKPWIDLFEQELKKWLETFAAFMCSRRVIRIFVVRSFVC